MRVIEIPPPVTVKVPMRQGEIDKEISFVKFLDEACGMYEDFAKGPKKARQFDKIMKVIEACAPEAKAIQFEDSDYEMIKSATDAAHWLTTSINRAYIPFYEAVEKAQKIDVPLGK